MFPMPPHYVIQFTDEIVYELNHIELRIWRQVSYEPTRDILIPVWCSNQQSYEATDISQ